MYGWFVSFPIVPFIETENKNSKLHEWYKIQFEILFEYNYSKTQTW